METTMMESTVGALVAAQPSRSRVFERVGIDYCCKGNVSLKQACEEKGVPLESVMRELTLTPATDEDEAVKRHWETPTTLVDYVVGRHHAYLWENLPRLDFLTGKVAAVHGGEDARLVRLREAFQQFKAETEEHLQKEEMMVFPFIKMLEAGQRPPFPPTITMPIRKMMQEHLGHGENLELFRELTDGFTPPPHACNTYRAMLQALEEMEGDLHRHIHLENTILFPWAEKLEAALGVDPKAYAGMKCH